MSNLFSGHPFTTIRAEHVAIIKRRNSKGEIRGSAMPVDNHEVKVYEGFPMAKFSFVSWHREMEEDALYWLFNGGILYLFDSSRDSIDYALYVLEHKVSAEEDLRWIRYIQDIYNTKSEFIEKAYKINLKKIERLKMALWSLVIVILSLTLALIYW